MITGEMEKVKHDIIECMDHPELVYSAGHWVLYERDVAGRFGVGDLCYLANRPEDEPYGECKVCQELRPIAEEAIAINRLEASVQ